MQDGRDALAPLEQLAVRDRASIGDDQGGCVGITVCVISEVYLRLLACAAYTDR
jgi:hypothetical protein